jgi:glutathione synthase/RimK-type ligase-like ATP-grasp enzyme
MKKIGILFGQENTFPQAFVDRINEKKQKDITAEFVRIDKVIQGELLDYAVIVDRISQDVPFYRAALKNAAISGTAVINNPFWWSADEKFFNNALAVKLGVPVPKTVLLPSKDHPTGTTDQSFRNLAYPLDWDGIFDYVGFPAYMKPFDGGGWRDVYKIEDKEDLWAKYDQTQQLVMLLQEEIIFDDYFRCYCIGGKHVRIMQYEPRNPHHLRYEHGKAPASKKMLDTITDYVLKLNKYLGYDFNTVEFAVRDGIPYAIDFCNPAPDADIKSVGQENFDWVVETAANYAIERAKAQKPGADNLTWGEYVRTGVNQAPLISTTKPAKATATEKVIVGHIDHEIAAEGVITKIKAAKPKATAKAAKATPVEEPVAKEPVKDKPKKAAKKKD